MINNIVYDVYVLLHFWPYGEESQLLNISSSAHGYIKLAMWEITFQPDTKLG